MPKGKQIKASEPTLKRLPIYLHYLQKVVKKGVLNISAPYVARDLKYDPTQVVKDLSVTGIKGKPRVGYNTYELVKSIEEFLDFNKRNEAFLFGAGNLGSALISYPALESFGIKIIAAFDINEKKVGEKIGDINVLNTNMFQELAEKLNIKIGILTTPAEAAQETAELMAAGGITGIWNLTPVSLKLPEGVVIQNTSMYSNVAVLLRKMKESNNK